MIKNAKPFVQQTRALLCQMDSRSLATHCIKTHVKTRHTQTIPSVAHYYRGELTLERVSWTRFQVRHKTLCVIFRTSSNMVTNEISSRIWGVLCACKSRRYQSLMQPTRTYQTSPKSVMLVKAPVQPQVLPPLQRPLFQARG